MPSMAPFISFFVGGGVDVIGFDDLEHLTKGLDLFQRNAIPIAGRVNGDGKADTGAEHEPGTDAQKKSTGARFRGEKSGHGRSLSWD